MSNKDSYNSEEIYPIILNSSNLVASAYQNQYTYTFPAGSIVFPQGSKIAVSNIEIFYSWANITAANGNNVLTIKWPGISNIAVTIPDGFYDITSLNSYLQYIMVQNSLYLIDASGNYVYYLEIVANASLYSFQINTYPIPSALPSGYTAPASWPGYSATTITPQLILVADLTTNLGFTAGTYPATTQSTTYSITSQDTPQITSIQSVIVACSLLNNKYSVPSTILYSFSAGGATFGDLISTSPSEFSYVSINAGQYPSLTITFYDQSYAPLPIQDSNLIIQLLVKTPYTS